MAQKYFFYCLFYMVLPVTPGLPLSASQIFDEFAVTAGTTQKLSQDLFPRIEGTAGSTCSFSSFSGKSTLNRFTYLQQTAGNHGAVGIRVDSSGNIIVAGFYSAAAAIYNMTLPPVSSGSSLPAPTNYDMYLLKYNSAGTLIGYTTLNGNNVDQTTELDVDSAGNIYVTGEYSSTTTVSIKSIALPPVASGFSLPASTSYDVYVIKWNSSGSLVSFTNLKASGTLDQGNSIRVDSSQNVYITGYYQAAATVPINTMSTAPAASGTSLPATAGGDDAFVIKWNSAGTLVSYTTIRGSGGDWGFGMDVDSSQNVYLSGYYNNTAGTIAINTMSLTPVSSGTSLPATSGQDAYVIKWNSAGTLVSYTTIKGTGTDSSGKVAVDSSQNVYLAGWYNSTTTVPINTMSLTPAASTYVLPISTGQDGFVIKWNSSGTLVSFTYISGTGSDYARGIEVDSSQNVYVVGSYNSTSAVTINTMGLVPASSGKTLSATSSDDIFVIKWNSAGSLVSYTRISGTGSDYPNIVFVDSNQNVYFTGLYSSTGSVNVNSMNLAPTSTGYTLPATSGGLQDAVVFKHGKTGV
jgi:hypothetical protein